jgi:hypothetical protein
MSQKIEFFIIIAVRTGNPKSLHNIIYKQSYDLQFVFQLYLYTEIVWGTQWRSWLRHYATSRKVAGSSPDDVDFFSIYLILPDAL